MAGVRDPAFWKRFSMAVHQDEENPVQRQPSKRSKDRDDDSWLARQQRKKRRRTKICWAFWVIFALIMGGLIAFLAWYGAFDGFAFNGETTTTKFRRRIRQEQRLTDLWKT